MFTFLKNLFKGFDPDITDSDENSVAESGGFDYDALWEEVTSKLKNKVTTRISIPKGRAYFYIASQPHKETFTYVGGYSVRGKFASFGIEAYCGNEGRDAIQVMIDTAPKGHLIKEAESKQGTKNKNKWAWAVATSIDMPREKLVKWYVDVIVEIYTFLEAQKPLNSETFEPTEADKYESVHKDSKKESVSRNYDKYAVNGVGEYGKARMVEATVNAYVNNNPSITIDALKYVFPQNLLKSYGVIRTEDDTIKDYKRFYESKLPDGTVFYICNQWGKDDTENFVQFVNKNVAGITISNSADQVGAEPASTAKDDAIAESAKKEAAAQAELAKKELEALKKAQAEAESMKAEAEKMRAEAEKARLEAEKAKVKAKDVPGKVASKEWALPGVFTLQDGKKIRFSQGNLQFHPKNYEFRFAKEQYETLGEEANEKCSSTLDGWIDIFGWGTSGYMGCQPTENDIKESSYGPNDGDTLTGKNANYDWGVYNPISNGGNKEGLWRTISPSAWNYLIIDRPNAKSLKLLCIVNGIKGFMLLPDDFWSNRLRFAIDVTSGWNGNIFNEEQWKQLEALGVVFFPNSYFKRCLSSSWGEGRILSTAFWTSDRSTTANYGYSCKEKFLYKYPVRLIQDVK